MKLFKTTERFIKLKHKEVFNNDTGICFHGIIVASQSVHRQTNGHLQSASVFL
ncbi:MAG TPA: hypothetical protein VK787_15540 [Puia sp.]|nr:hypothetical protein [Puia sp.]